MKSALFILLAFLPIFAKAELSIQNFFTVDQSATVFRGREPGKKVAELASLNVTDVIIFKNDVRGEVERELGDLESLGIAGHHIPFHWKEIPSMQVACEQIIDALSIIKQVQTKGGSVFFHCTAGEDRTGLLAGLIRMIDEGLDQKTAFVEEMCARGYSDGNLKKPWMVTRAIESGLTPLFIGMARLVEKGDIAINKLDKNICRNLEMTKEIMKCRQFQK